MLATAPSPETDFAIAGDLALPGLPGLSASKFTALDQSEAPDEPRTRIVKDVLHCGSWHHDDGEPWEVSEDTLHELAANYANYRKLGYASNLIWGHTDDNREAIAPIDEFIVADGVLWASAYVTPDVAKQLSNPAHKVSIGVMDDFEDGKGNTYSQLPFHVAVVEAPVVGPQGAFRQLQNKRLRLSLLTGNKIKRRKELAMDFETFKSLLNQLFDSVAPELKVPDHVVDEDTFQQWVQSAVAFVDPNASTSEPTDGDGATEGAPAADPVTGEATNVPEAAMMSKLFEAALAPINKQLSSLAGQVKTLANDKANDAKKRFMDRLNELGSAGLPGAKVAEAKSLGAKCGYDLTLLSAYEGFKGLNMSRIAKSSRNGAAPAVSTNGAPSDEDVAEELKRRGKDPAKMPAARR